MLIFIDKRLTFLANPKTGTTAIETALGGRAEIIFTKERKHLNAKRYQSKIAPFLKSAFGVETETVAVMREPLDQIRSWYRYRARDAVAGLDRSTRDISFDDYIKEVVSDTPREHARIGTQRGFLTNKAGELAVDHLFAYTAQEALLAFLSDRLDTDITLKRRNVSPALKAPLSPDMTALLKAARAKEFALYDRLMAAGGYLKRP
ncbi:hypothetical protein [Roseobacter weihaiensis]|uniref:hypothetical protein n=1 Tax=Roseobacter weihaiensis TaxID=2763262 RepID=UPI001D0ABFE4|nr:hypothetical protein [Roseobacter sp. H9]